MARNMSFMLTTNQIREGTKTVTRRVGWWNLKAGEIVNACEKCQGLRKGEKINVIRQIQIVDISTELLNDIWKEDVVREGFPEMSEQEFVKMFVATHKGSHRDTIVNRIEFKYIN